MLCETQSQIQIASQLVRRCYPETAMETSSQRTRSSLRDRQRALGREAIVEAAYQLFERRAYDDVTVADIADAAVVSRATFFRYFDDKQEVVFARQPEIHDAVAAGEFDRPAAVPATLPIALEQLREIVVGVYRDIERHPWHQIHERLIDENPGLHDRHVRKLLQFADGMAQLLEHRGAKPGVAVLAAQTAVACCLAGRRLRTGKRSMAATVDSCFRQYL
jgi:AcrR family transcriptional regulator